MGNVRSEPMRSGSRASGALSLIGAVFLAISVGPLFFLLNGGYSIVGMAWLAEHTGGYGRLFWQLATTWTVDVPVAQRAGLPLAQPIIPWLMVGGISFMQIGMMIRRLRRDRSEPWLDLGSMAVSAFDYVTTLAGLVFAPFVIGTALLIHALWGIICIGLAIPLTFAFEALLARALQGRRHVRSHHTGTVGHLSRARNPADDDRLRQLLLDDDARR